MPSMQMPPFLHGLEAHSLILISQFFPVQPIWHLHMYSLSVSDDIQTPSFLHGFCSHSRAPSWDSQRLPVNPDLQLQTKLPSSSSMQIPPLWQGLLSQGGPERYAKKGIIWSIIVIIKDNEGKRRYKAVLYLIDANIN